MSQNRSISSLAKDVANANGDELVTEKGWEENEQCGNGWWFFLFWFLIVGIIVWFLLFALKPDFVQHTDEDDNATGEVDQGKVLLWAVIIALAIIFLMWIFQWGFRGNYY